MSLTLLSRYHYMYKKPLEQEPEPSHSCPSVPWWPHHSKTLLWPVKLLFLSTSWHNFSKMPDRTPWWELGHSSVGSATFEAGSNIYHFPDDIPELTGKWLQVLPSLPSLNNSLVSEQGLCLQGMCCCCRVADRLHIKSKGFRWDFWWDVSNWKPRSGFGRRTVNIDWHDAVTALQASLCSYAHCETVSKIMFWVNLTLAPKFFVDVTVFIFLL